jgi:hypothetical protein
MAMNQGDLVDEDDNGEVVVNLGRVGLDDDPSPEEAFANLCAKLQRNDPEQTWLYSPLHVQGYGIRLGNALVGNNHVERLTLSLRPEDVNSPDSDNWGVESIALILQYLREGTAFRELNVSRGALQYVRPCVAAIAQNPATTKLILDEQAEIPIAEVANLLRTSQSLKTIVMSMVDSLELAEAFQVNQTLDFVTFMFDPDSLPRPNGLILHHMVSNRPPCALTISEKYESSGMDALSVDTAVATLVSRAVWLTELRLSGLSFHRSRMQLLMDGLLSNRSIGKFELLFCTFDDEAISLFDSLVTSTSNREAFAESMIRELSVMDGDDALSDDFAALFVLGFPCLRLTWQWQEPFASLGAFWNLLATNSSKVQLQVLQLRECLGVTDEDMNMCIPLLPTLRELRFDVSRYYRNFDNKMTPFLQSMRKSSGLLHVAIAGRFPDFWSEAEARIVRASFQHNQDLLKLVSQPRVDREVHDGDENTEITLYPSLFHAAEQSLRIAPNSIFAGLLALDEDIGFV